MVCLNVVVAIDGPLLYFLSVVALAIRGHSSGSLLPL